MKALLSLFVFASLALGDSYNVITLECSGCPAIPELTSINNNGAVLGEFVGGLNNLPLLWLPDNQSVEYPLMFISPWQQSDWTTAGISLDDNNSIVTLAGYEPDGYFGVVSNNLGGIQDSITPGWGWTLSNDVSLGTEFSNGSGQFIQQCEGDCFDPETYNTIAGYLYTPNSSTRLSGVEAVPEPSTFVLVGGALLLLVKRRKHGL